MTTENRPAVEVMLRIPGAWSGPKDIMDRLPDGYRIVGNQLILPDQTEIDVFPIPSDGQFPSVFRTSLRQPANAEELEIVDRSTSRRLCSR